MQISKNLKTCSQALRKAVDDYNVAAGRLGHEQVRPDNVLSYVYLHQFDLLRLSKHKILDKPWSKGVAREASAAYFKLKRSHEELRRLDAEVERWLAYTRSHFNKVEEVLSTLQETDPDLARHISRHHEYRKQQDLYHWTRLNVEGHIQRDRVGSGSFLLEDSVASQSSDDRELDSEDDEEAHEVISRTFEALGRMG